MHSAHDLVDGLQGGLSESIDIRARNIAEVDCTAHTVCYMTLATDPLVGFEQCAGESTVSAVNMSQVERIPPFA